MVEIVQGADKVFTVRLRDQDDEPIDLSSATAIEISFRKADETELELSLGSGIALVGTGVLGKFTVTISDTQSALLKSIANATMEVRWTIGSLTTKKQVLRSYSVLPALF